MPADRQHAEGGQREDADQHRPRRPDRALNPARQEVGKETDHAFGARPLLVGMLRKVGADGDADAVRDQQDESGAEDCGATPGERTKPFERRECPKQTEHRDHDGPDTEQLPQHPASRASPAARPRHRQQREAQEEAEQQGRDADELLPSFLIHAAMRRSAETGTMNRLSGLAQYFASSPRPASPSWRAASLAPSASSQPPCWAARSSETCAASFSVSFFGGTPFLTALIRRPAV